MRAIDADAFDKRVRIAGGFAEEDLTDDFKDGVLTILEMLKSQPTIEPQRKKGKWVFKERREPVYDLSDVKTWGIAYMCSECGFIHTVIEDFGQYAYCPNCGAEMEGEE